MAEFLVNLGLVAAGSAAGGVSRHWVSTVVHRCVGVHFPWGTLVVNASGALLMGVLAGLLDRGLTATLADETRLLLMIGLCGGYTTVSSFALQTWTLMNEQRLPAAVANATVSALLCLAALLAGLALAGASLPTAGV